MKKELLKSFLFFIAPFLFCSYTQGQLLTQEVCLVTVDLSTQKNVIVWEKTPGQGIKWFVIYKEVSLSVYDSIGYVPYDSLSIYTDYSSDATIKSDRYYVTAVDSGNNESLPGTPHKTVHFTVQLDTNNMPSLSWENYEGFWYPQYRIWRGTTPTNVAVFDSVGWSTTAYTDTMQGDSLYYLGEVVRSLPCSATVKLKTYNASKSNTALLAAPIPVSVFSVSDPAKFVSLKAFPNPYTDQTLIEYSIPAESHVTLEVLNMIGEKRVIFLNDIQPSGKHLFPLNNGLSGFQGGIYLVKLQVNSSVALLRLVQLK